MEKNLYETNYRSASQEISHVSCDRQIKCRAYRSLQLAA
jgi:hypothetical protein